jgi:hypothetical protein
MEQRNVSTLERVFLYILVSLTSRVLEYLKVFKLLNDKLVDLVIIGRYKNYDSTSSTLPNKFLFLAAVS